MLEPAVAREEERRNGERGDGGVDGRRGREREREADGESEEGQRIGPMASGNLINVNAAATAGATHAVCGNRSYATHPCPFRLALSFSFSSIASCSYHPALVPRSPTTLATPDTL